ncbi:MAG: sigma-54-dependent Fis family transcriptional regulator [Planctomycetes bacterium]|nr:sigma-54-dependent Fis family transcriptional regulator [Planctomycetota bacterium]
MTPPPGCSVLVVDDDRSHREMLRAVLGDLGYDAACAEDGERALQMLAERMPSLVLLDMRMPGLDGLGTLRAMRERGLTPTTIVVTAHADLDEAVAAMKLGAVDYLRKPIDIESLRALLARHCGVTRAAEGELPHLPEGVVAAAPLTIDVCRDLLRIAPSNAAVLLHGETGTGKEVFADLLHRWSPRHAGPLVAVNMAALPESLVESELFGHQKGAFTGAIADQRGRVQDADGGTLFLDEIGELPIALQPKLLRALETHRVSPLGCREEREIDFRLVTATNRDLDAEVQAGRFRQDLYYRIAVITVEIPPLRERSEDVLPLAQLFLQREGRKRLSPAAAARLRAYPWPGNVRELQNAMLRAAILAAGEVVLPENLPPALQAAPPAPEPRSDLALSLAELERRAIVEMLERTDGNRSEAARLLGISRRKLLYRLKEYGASNGGQ